MAFAHAVAQRDGRSAAWVSDEPTYCLLFTWNDTCGSDEEPKQIADLVKVIRTDLAQ